MNTAQMLVDSLLATAAVTAYVEDRIYESESPKVTTATHVRVNELSGGRLHNLDLAFPLIQVSVFAKKREDAIELRDVLIPILRDSRLVVDGTFVVCTLQDDRLIQEDTWWHVPLTFGVKYQEV
ncbi:MAG: hypothetical protein WC483_06065 [Candidatus Paceibacterota bacterium]